MATLERYRVFRLAGDEPQYVGTYEAPNPKDAVKQAVYADPAGGDVYEAHVLRNASLFDARWRDERFIDSLTQLNTERHFAGG